MMTDVADKTTVAFHRWGAVLVLEACFVSGAALVAQERATPPGRAAEVLPLGPEMAQLEKDMASESYPKLVRGFTNINDLNAEILRADLPDDAERFAAAHGGLEKLRADPRLFAAYERRRKVGEAFLELVREQYERIGKRDQFEASLKALRREEGKTAAAKAAAEPSPGLDAILPAPGAEKEWPRWRGPWGTGRSDEPDAPLSWKAGPGGDENVLWKVKVPGEGNSSPVVWGETIFVTTAFDRGQRRSLAAFRRGDGSLLWLSDAPRVEPEGRVIAKNGYASATPATDGERVVCFFGNTGLVAFDFAGKLLWHRPFETFDAMHGTGASPLLLGGLAVLIQEQSDRPSVGIAVDKTSGEVRWRAELPPALGWCTPIALRVEGRDELVCGTSRAVVSFDPQSGEELWYCGGPTHEVIPTLVYGHGLVFSCSGRNGPTLAIRPGGSGDVTESRLEWKVVRGGPHVPSPVLVGELLFLVNDTGVLTCLEARSGKTVYQQRLNGKFSASPVAVAGRIYLTNEDGETFVVRAAREYALLGQSSLGEGALASMAVRGGRIYARGKQHLFAIGAKTGP
jgi:outer membrane protein assembly factor BamB